MTLSDRVRSLQLPSNRPSGQQPFGRWWLPWALCAMLAVLAVFFAVRSPFGAGRLSAEEMKDELEAMLAEKGSAAQAADQGQFSVAGPAAGLKADAVVLESKGNIVPVQLIQVSPKVTGMVTRLNVREGMLVTQGDILAKLEMVEYESGLRRAQAIAEAAWQRWLELSTGNRPEEIAQAQAELNETRVLAEQYKRDMDRDERLVKTNGVSAKEVELSRMNYHSTTQRAFRLTEALKMMRDGARIERIDAAWADVAQAEADLVKAQWLLDNCTVQAPISGTILTKKAEEGNIVNPAAFNISASLCEMADLFNLEVDLAIAERDIAKLFQGQKCIVRAEAFLGRPYPGVVSRLMPQADRAKAAVPVRVKVLIGPRHIVLAETVGLTTSPFGGPLLAGTAFGSSPTEAQGQFLRPDMGALVTFLNARAEE
jgi:multidrug resistance efflux pump